jgi:diguanylate cyclase (GGDEF)-like protein
MLADARTGELQVQHTVGVRDDEIARRERTRNPVVRAALERGGIEYVPDTAADERFRHETPGSFVAVPVRGRIVGVITLLRDERDAFRPEEIDFLRLVAHYVALAVSNAVLFRTTREQALEDPLTGLANRRSFMESYEVEWNLASRLGSPFAVLMLDVDFFKRFNDTFGHPVGDEVLKTIAQTVRSLVRKVDIVGRYGGEEFVVALPGASLDAAMDVAEKVRSTIRQLRFPMANGDGAHLAVSIGVASSNGGGVDAGELIRHADVALLAAKTLGRDRVEAYRAPPRR